MKQTIQIYLLVFALISAITGGIVWIITYVNNEISPVQAQTTENTKQVYDVRFEVGKANTKLDFLLEERGARYDENKGVIIKK